MEFVQALNCGYFFPYLIYNIICQIIHQIGHAGNVEYCFCTNFWWPLIQEITPDTITSLNDVCFDRYRNVMCHAASDSNPEIQCETVKSSVCVGCKNKCTFLCQLCACHIWFEEGLSAKFEDKRF